jgi:cell division protein FtsB
MSCNVKVFKGSRPRGYYTEINTMSTDSSAATISVASNNASGTASGTASAPDVTSILAQIAKLEQHNASLKNELTNKSQEVSKLSEKKRQEMKIVYDTVLSKWVDTLDATKPEARDLFKNGLQNLAEKTEDENGIWQVVMCASANAAKKEGEYQALQAQYDQLKQRAEGGQFGREDDRIGSKRSALAPPEEEACMRSGGKDVWSEFETFMKAEFKPEYTA